VRNLLILWDLLTDCQLYQPALLFFSYYNNLHSIAYFLFVFFRDLDNPVFIFDLNSMASITFYLLQIIIVLYRTSISLNNIKLNVIEREGVRLSLLSLLGFGFIFHR